MDEFKKYIEQSGLKVTDRAMSDLQTYLKELLEWNQKFNLTAIRNEHDIWIKHFLDSATVLEAIPEKSIKVIDIGTGAGFPGLVVKILRPKLHLTLVESIGKKVTFLKHIREKLNLDNVEIIQTRAETLGAHPNYRESFDVALSRAVAYLPTLLEYTIPFLKVGGVLVAQKSRNTDEIAGAQNALRTLDAKVTSTQDINIASLPDRHLITIEKTAKTDPLYPRGEGLPKSRPL